MELEGVVRDGVVVPDDGVTLTEGTRVRIEPVPAAVPPPAGAERPKTFGEQFARFRGAIDGLPEDLAAQHDHYRLGTPKR